MQHIIKEKEVTAMRKPSAKRPATISRIAGPGHKMKDPRRVKTHPHQRTAFSKKASAKATPRRRRLGL